MTLIALIRTPSLRPIVAFVLLGILSSGFAQSSLAEPTPTPQAQSRPTRPGLAQALGISELKLQMAESTYKLRPSIKTLSDVVSSLEDIINATCLAQVPRTLSFNGKPSDPTCVGLMERILELHPENPVGLCLRDGIEAPSCTNAYAKQVTTTYSSSIHESVLSDPSMRIGLTREENEKLVRLSEGLSNLNQRYQSTQDLGEKQQCIDEAADVYDQALAIACRITAVALMKSDETFDPGSDSEIRDIRQKLTNLPQSIREDHQGRMLLDAEGKLKEMKANSAAWTRQKEVIRAIKNPELEPIPAAASLQRTRILLPICIQFIQQATAATPGFPSPVCHKEGWYSPQCVAALKNWRVIKAQRKAAASGTPGAVSKPTSVISTF